MWDKTTSYRFVEGRLVARTAEEHTELQRRRALTAVPPRMPKSTERFVKITLRQLDKLYELKSQACTFIFMIMLYEDFRCRGGPFILPTARLAANGGYNPRTQRRATRQLQACGLIAVERRSRKPPQITVL
jgi:hypothetical protein